MKVFRKTEQLHPCFKQENPLLAPNNTTVQILHFNLCFRKEGRQSTVRD